MSQRISPNLTYHRTASGSDICCSACGHVVAPAGADQHWKDLAVFSSRRVRDLPGWPEVVHPDMVLREFSCGGCGALLDSEMSLKEDPFLYDTVQA